MRHSGLQSALVFSWVLLTMAALWGCSFASPEADATNQLATESEITCAPFENDTELCSIEISDGHGALILRPTGSVATETATLVDVGGPFRPKASVETGMSTLWSLAADTKERWWVGMYDIKPVVSEECQSALDIWGSSWTEVPLDTQACNLDELSAKYRSDELDATEALLESIGDPPQLEVWGISFAAARWADLAERVEADAFYFVSPFNAGLSHTLLIEESAAVNAAAWKQVFDGGCTARACLIDVEPSCAGNDCWNIDTFSGAATTEPMVSALGLLGAAPNFAINSAALLSSAESDVEMLRDQLERLASSYLRVNAVGEVDSSWITHLAGLCALSSPDSDDREWQETFEAAVAAVLAPCGTISDQGRYVSARDRGAERTVNARACIVAPSPDLVLGAATQAMVNIHAWDLSFNSFDDAEHHHGDFVLLADLTRRPCVTDTIQAEQ